MSDVVVRIVGNIRDLQTNLAKASAAVKSFASTAMRPITGLDKAFKGLFNVRNLAIAGGLAAITKIGAAAEESENLFETAFGGMADSVRQWSEQLGSSLKLSATGLRQNVAGFKSFLDGLDMTEESATKMSKALTEMSLDLASRRNLSFADSMQKVQAALAGEQEPLRRLGITVSDVTMRTWAAKEGLDANTASWSEQQKIIARYGVIAQGLRKDMGDLAATADSVTNISRSLSDQIREMAIAIYQQWRPTIQSTLKGVRDWILENRDTIAKWAGIVGAHVTYTRDVFVGLLRTMQESPKEGFQVLLKSLIEVMKAAAEIAVDLAVRIGKGIWEGVRRGVLGDAEDEGAIRKRAMDLYKEAGGGTYNVTKFVGGDIGAPAENVTIEQPNSVSMYNRAMDQARLEAQQRRAKEISSPILAGFGEGIGETLKTAGQNIVASTETFRPYAEEAAANLKSSLAEIDAKFAPSSDAGQAIAETSGAVDELSGKLKEMHQQAAGSGSNAVAAFTKRLQDQIDAMTELNGTILQGRTAYEAAAEKQKLLNDAIAAGVVDLSEIVPAVDAYVRALQDLEQQQRGSGGFLGGLKDLKRELPSLQEQLYDIGKAAREGIVNSLADAVFEAKNLGDALRDVLKNMARMMFEYQMQRAVAGMSVSFSNWLSPDAAMRGVALPSTGGSTPVYAASGAYVPRGTDTVPAMLTPGEAVLDKDTTAGLRRVFGGAGNIQAAPPVINITNQTSTPVEENNVQNNFDGRQYVTSIVLRDQKNYGPLSRGRRKK